MAKMTPEQEAAYALDWDLGRESLSPAAQAEYDRLQKLGRAAAATGGAAPTASGNGSDAAGQEAYFASTRNADGIRAAAGPAAARQAETLELKYMRQTRTAVVFIAVVVGVVCALALIGAIITGVQLSRVSNQLSNLNGGAASISNCASQGGTDSSC